MRRSLFSSSNLILLTALLCVLPLAAQISGVVRDPSGAPVQGARVHTESGPGTRGPAVLTASDGRFALPRAAGGGGRALVVVEANEFDRYVKEVSTSDAKLEVKLTVRGVAQQVTVTANAYAQDLDDSARATAVIGRGELDQRMEFSVAESLRETAGVRVTQSGGPGSLTNIRIRGLRPQDTSIVMDGVRFRDPAATQGDATGYTAELMTLNIARLEVLRGCGSSLYGSNAMGGVVNIVSDPGGGKLRGDFIGEGGGIGFLRSHLRVAGGTGADRLTYSLGAGHVNILEGADGDDRARTSSAQAFAQFRATGTLLLSARLSAANSLVGLNISPSITANAPRTGQVNAIPLPDSEVEKRQLNQPFTLGNATVIPSLNDPDSRRESWFTSALFAADQQLTPRWHYRVAYQLVDARRQFPNGPGGVGFQPVYYDNSIFNGRIDTAQARATHSTTRNIFTAGAEWEREAFDNGGLSRGATTAQDSSYRAQVAQRSAAVFAEDRVRLLGSRLQISFSGRFQTFNLSRPEVSGSLPAYLTAPVPSPPNALTGDVSAMYRWHTNTKLRAHIGNAFRAPSLYERYGTGFFAGTFTPYGDPRLAPERVTGGDAGIDQYIGNRRARLSATYFYSELRSVIGFDFTGIVNRTTDPFGRNSGYFNTNGGLARGVELEAETALWRGFRLTGAYTHTRTLERRAVAAGTLLTPRIFPNAVSFTALQTFKRVTLTANFLGVPEYIGVISGRAVRWDGPRRLDATASFRLWNSERFKPEFVVRGENLLGQTYYEDGFRTPKRWYVAGLRLGF